MRILVTGAGGMLGSDVVLAFQNEHEILATGRKPGLVPLDITDADAVERTFSNFQPEAVVHCAAMTHVDRCERNPEEAFRINAHGSSLLASACSQWNAPLVYLSTDYVFDGQARRAYHEYDEPNPINSYGRSKWEGEKAVQSLCPRHYIVRTAWLYGLNGRCFPKTVLEMARAGRTLQVVKDQIGSPTFTRDLAQALLSLLRIPAYGVYHVVNAGAVSWYEFTCEALRLAETSTEVIPISSAEWSSPTHRPPYSALTSLRGRWLGLPPLRSWQEALQEFISEMRNKSGGESDGDK